jgi:hypothetical protein
MSTTMTDADPVLDVVAHLDDADAAQVIISAIAARFDGVTFDYIVETLTGLQACDRATRAIRQVANAA